MAQFRPTALYDSSNLDPEVFNYYQFILKTLNEAKLPYLVGGAFAARFYTGIEVRTKDLDLFTYPETYPKILELFSQKGLYTEVTFPQWLGKIFYQEKMIDLIFNSGNGLAPVDEEWFSNAPSVELLGIPAFISPPEEMIWTKAFIMERERFDGADILHLLKACGPSLDWSRLLKRFGEHWPVLLAHLILYDYSYPAEKDRIPLDIFENLLARQKNELYTKADSEKICRGTLMSRAQYLIDVHDWGYQDARLKPQGNLSPEEINQLTADIEEPRQVLQNSSDILG